MRNTRRAIIVSLLVLAPILGDNARAQTARTPSPSPQFQEAEQAIAKERTRLAMVKGTLNMRTRALNARAERFLMKNSDDETELAAIIAAEKTLNADIHQYNLAYLAFAHAKWDEGGKPAPEIDLAINAAIDTKNWPVDVRMALHEITFVWVPNPPADRILVGRPSSRLPYTIWFRGGKLAVSPALTDPTVLTKGRSKAHSKAHAQLLAFEFGKLIRDAAEKLSDPLAKRFDAIDNAHPLPLLLPDVTEVKEGDRFAAFGYAYYYFLSDPAKLPEELVKEWRENPPHGIVRKEK